MQGTYTWIRDAGGITVLLLALAGILMRRIGVARHREATLDHERAVPAAANSELQLAKSLADGKPVHLAATLAGMSDGMAMIDGNMRLVEWKARFPEIAGVPSAMLRVGLPIEDIIRAQAAGGKFGNVDIEAEVARRIADLRAGRYAETFKRKGPDGRVVELRRNLLPDGGCITVYTDITSRPELVNRSREASALAEATTKAMSRFVAIASDELRTPLNALLNSLRLLSDSGMAASQRMLLDMARQSGDALLAMINDLPEISRTEAGQLVLRPSVFALRPLIENVLEMFSAEAAGRRIALRYAIAPGVPAELYEDPASVRQVLINLLSNTVKFASSGEVRVIVEPHLEREQRRVRLAVRDRGPVIPVANRAGLFQPFSGLDNEGAVAPAGAGLGLAICQHLVALMGGEIGCCVWTVIGRDAGNEFWLTLPIKPVPNAVHSASERPSPRLRRGLPRTRILLADILADQLVTATLLRREGHLVDIANCGPEAISAMVARPYDLILMDILMPGMSGLDATRCIRSLGGPAATVPILALTANIRPKDQAACAAAGMNGMLGKPVAVHELLDAIAQHVWPHRPCRLPLELPSGPIVPAASRVLSTARLDELRAMLPTSKLAALVEECLVELSERLAALQQAVRQQDIAQIVSHAHAMAGISAEYGMATLESRLRGLLRAARQAPQAVAVLAGELEAELFLAATALRETFHIEMV
jgi:signal transduction histidine kinase/CheY-like chemotaxis protein